MPKETISGDGFDVQVAWGKDREVQLGVVAPEGRSLFWTLTGTSSDIEQEPRTRRLAELGALVREAVAQAPAATEDSEGKSDDQLHADSVLATLVLDHLDTITRPCADSIWSTLSRHGCNEVIRNLRRARDGAYGRDE